MSDRAAPITTWAACARCVHGDARGEICRVSSQPQPTAHARSLLGRCGAEASLHVYRAPAPEAPPLTLWRLAA